MTLKECFDKGLLARTRPSLNKAKQSLASAKSSLKKARDNLRIDNSDIAVVMAYTAMFHSFRAVLFMEGVKERSHVCMLKYIEHTSDELKGLAKEADVYRRFRHSALYGLDVLVSRDDAQGAIKSARKTISSVEIVLKKRPSA
jgi:uncharacterized protein (UPF0332 family)